MSRAWIVGMKSSASRVSTDSQADWDRVLTGAKAGDTVEIRFLQRGAERRATLRFASDPEIELVRAEAAGGEVSPEQMTFRQAWLGAAT